MDAGGAALVAWTIRNQVAGGVEQHLDAVEQAGGEPDAARLAVVEEDRGALDLRVPDVGDSAYVVAIAEREQRKQR